MPLHIEAGMTVKCSIKLRQVALYIFHKLSEVLRTCTESGGKFRLDALSRSIVLEAIVNLTPKTEEASGEHFQL